MRRLSTVIAWLLKTLAVALMVATPLLGTWGASSLAAFGGGNLWLAGACGLLLFPAGPLAWEAWARARPSGRARRREAVLTWGDRLILRTLALNAVFLAVLLGAWPAQLFTALSARGDWFLDGRHSQQAELARGALFAMADRLEWLYALSQDNPYAIEEDGGEAPPDEPPRAGTLPDAGASASAAADARDAGSERARERDAIPDAGRAARDAGVAPAQAALPDAGARVASTDAGVRDAPVDDGGGEPPEQPWAATVRWPMPVDPHPAVSSMPESAKQRLPDIVEHVRRHERNPFLQVKAIHDYVVDHVHYDFASLDAGDYPPYDPGTVNRRRKAVCAGYSKLFQALCRLAGFDVRYVVGKVRDERGDFDGDSHAWNAILIEDGWYLVDATWDSGHASREPEPHRTEYLFTPPQVFASDHFPDNPRWQLLQERMTRGEFLRQPTLSPSFHARKLELIDPTRSHLDVADLVEVQLRNPAGGYVIGRLEDEHGERHHRCETGYRAAELTLHCRLPGEGMYRLLMFANDERYGDYDYVGRFTLSSRL